MPGEGNKIVHLDTIGVTPLTPLNRRNYEHVVQHDSIGGAIFVRVARYALTSVPVKSSLYERRMPALSMSVQQLFTSAQGKTAELHGPTCDRFSDVDNSRHCAVFKIQIETI